MIDFISSFLVSNGFRVVGSILFVLGGLSLIMTDKDDKNSIFIGLYIINYFLILSYVIPMVDNFVSALSITLVASIVFIFIVLIAYGIIISIRDKREWKERQKEYEDNKAINKKINSIRELNKSFNFNFEIDEILNESKEKYEELDCMKSKLIALKQESGLMIYETKICAINQKQENIIIQLTGLEELLVNSIENNLSDGSVKDLIEVIKIQNADKKNSEIEVEELLNQYKI